jgi:hypothetical protein
MGDPRIGKEMSEEDSCNLLIHLQEVAASYARWAATHLADKNFEDSILFQQESAFTSAYARKMLFQLIGDSYVEKDIDWYALSTEVN